MNIIIIYTDGYEEGTERHIYIYIYIYIERERVRGRD